MKVKKSDGRWLMHGMVHTAKRLLPYAKNKIIHVDAVEDPVLLRLIKDDRVLPHLRAGLKEIDPQYEILIPFHVDDEEQQLRRYIQYKYGTKVNLSAVRRDNLKYYLKLYGYGSPAEVIRRWGLTPTHDHIYTEELMLEALNDFKNDDGVVSGVYSNSRLYRSLKYYAKKSGKPIKTYLADKGIKYKGNG